jgi:ferritin
MNIKDPFLSFIATVKSIFNINDKFEQYELMINNKLNEHNEMVGRITNFINKDWAVTIDKIKRTEEQIKSLVECLEVVKENHTEIIKSIETIEKNKPNKTDFDEAVKTISYGIETRLEEVVQIQGSKLAEQTAIIDEMSKVVDSFNKGVSDISIAFNELTKSIAIDNEIITQRFVDIADQIKKLEKVDIKTESPAPVANHTRGRQRTKKTT